MFREKNSPRLSSEGAGPAGLIWGIVCRTIIQPLPARCAPSVSMALCSDLGGHNHRLHQQPEYLFISCLYGHRGRAAAIVRLSTVSRDVAAYASSRLTHAIRKADGGDDGSAT